MLIGWAFPKQQGPHELKPKSPSSSAYEATGINRCRHLYRIREIQQRDQTTHQK